MAVSQWIKVALVEDVEPGTGFQVEIDDEPVALWNVEGNFYATSDTCSHEEATLTEGDLWDNLIECPLHGAQFDVRTGEPRTLPAVLPIATYPIRVDGDALYIEWTRDR